MSVMLERGSTVLVCVCICQVEEEQRADARLRQEQGIEWQPKVH